MFPKQDLIPQFKKLQARCAKFKIPEEKRESERENHG